MHRLAVGRIRAEVETRGATFSAGLRRTLVAELQRFGGDVPGVKGSLQVRLFAATSGGALCRGCLLFLRLGRTRRAVVASGIDTDLRRAMRAAFSRLGQAVRGSALARVAH